MSRDERLARNESRFRLVNEGIAAGRGLRDVEARLSFVCECGQLGCTEILSVSVGEYEAIRRSGRRFLVAPGHVDRVSEVVVREADDHAVVEKLGDAGDTADDLDPREPE